MSATQKGQKEEKHTDIENYKMEPFTEKGLKPFLEKSTFEIMFPRHREKYIRETEEYVKKAMAQKKLSLSVDYHELVLRVETTQHTRDPYSIVQGRDCLKVLSRGVPLEKAIKVFEENVTYDIIQINTFTRNKEIFLKRRERLLGPHGNTIKSLELLTDCYILPYGNTVTAIGHYKSLKEVRRVVTRCMENIHPIYEIKRLMIKRELEKDPNLKTENWERYLPQYKKTHSKKQKKTVTEKTERKTFPEQEERKEDREMMTGEYFSKDKSRSRKK
ncbi:ribosomal RNA assembly protein [Nematocida minor]|uniref:ribosomal RNA assembly protein n=1 Tax=Nematocida minor TaxID=1912983 RepID=UPI002220F96C|nr:ribosomal RNA assembly protein [Nematocida minor]KAI5190260.1 ribosomal RNA assembly protein [Nematocida minor]